MQTNEELLFYKRAIKPEETVQTIFNKVNESKFSVLLESSIGYIEKTSRFSIISALPESLITLKNNILSVKSLNKNNILNRFIHINSTNQVFNILYEMLDSIKPSIYNPEIEQLPFLGGFLGFISYDFVRYIEKIDLKNNIENIPDLQFILTKNFVITDNLDSTLWIIAENDDNLNCLIEKVNNNNNFNNHYSETTTLSEVRQSFDEAGFIDAVEKTKDYIKQGEIYQANISIQFNQELKIEPFTFYRNLYKINPSPFSSYINFDNICIVCNSPERLVKNSSKNELETRPIAGTRGRNKDKHIDHKLENELIKCAKERSEHIMLVDLERNDMGKVCNYGSVMVDEIFSIEKYSHVMHLVSNIKGKLNNKFSYIDIIPALFPGGTITGVPKIRCMEIIEEIEPVRRSIYTGSIGYIDTRGCIDLNIVIRSMLLNKLKDNHYNTKMQFGAGIVADSVGKYEYKECIKKGNAIFELLGSSYSFV